MNASATDRPSRKPRMDVPTSRRPAAGPAVGRSLFRGRRDWGIRTAMASDSDSGHERPLIIPGFRQLLHGGDDNPYQWLGHPEVIDEDFRLMDLAGTNAFAVGIFAWTSYEPSEGQYDFSWLDRIMGRMADAGKKVILATPSGAKPAWMSAKY